MRIEIGNQIVVHEPTKSFTDWVNRELTLLNPDYVKKVRMNLWTGRTPRTIQLFEQNGDDLILPFGVQDDVIERREGASVTLTYQPNPDYVFYECDIPLYDYQQKAVAAMVWANYGILQAPAGCGKTQMGIAIAARLCKRTLWVTHTLDLVKQSKERAEQYLDKRLIGVIKEGHVQISNGITFATVQTLAKMDLTKYRDYWDVIIVDECHRVSGTPTSVTMFSKVLNSLSARHKYGLSATVHRSDGLIQATYSLLGKVMYEVPKSEVENRVMPVTVQAVETDFRVDERCVGTDGMIKWANTITAMGQDAERNRTICDLICENRNEPCLILSDRLEHLVSMMEMLPNELLKLAVMIDGKMVSKTAKAAREQAVEDMRTGKKRFLFASYNLAKEGLDIPNLSRLFLTTPHSDEAVIIQSVGRIARTSDGKSEPIAYDFVDHGTLFVKLWKKRLSAYRKAGCNV